MRKVGAMNKHRRKHTAEFKARVALEIVQKTQDPKDHFVHKVRALNMGAAFNKGTLNFSFGDKRTIQLKENSNENFNAAGSRYLSRWTDL
jgi:hypothetical protein